MTWYFIDCSTSNNLLQRPRCIYILIALPITQNFSYLKPKAKKKQKKI